MSVRAGVVLVQDGRVCLIRRDRNGSTYYLCPGGGTDPGVTPAEAAAREALEELGLHVRVERLLARMYFDGNDQLYFHATVTGGTFGAGTGEELASPPDSKAGSYTPVWLPLADLPRHDVRPRQLAEIVGMPTNGFQAPSWTSRTDPSKQAPDMHRLNRHGLHAQSAKCWLLDTRILGR